MRISDWSSDVCSSDLEGLRRRRMFPGDAERRRRAKAEAPIVGRLAQHEDQFGTGGASAGEPSPHQGARKSDVEGKSVSVRVDLGGRGNIKQRRISHINMPEEFTTYMYV